MQNTQNLTFKKKASGADVSRLVWAAVFPVAAFFLTIFTISIFKTFGRVLIAPLSGVMWIVGAAMTLWMPMQRKAIINETLIAVASYCGSLLTLRELIAITSGASSQMLMATFGEAITTATANTVPGFLQNALFLTGALLPFGYLGMQGKRLVSWRRQRSVQKTMESLRSIRNK